MDLLRCFTVLSCLGLLRGEPQGKLHGTYREQGKGKLHGTYREQGTETYSALTDPPNIRTTPAETYSALTDPPNIRTTPAETYSALTDHLEITTTPAGSHSLRYLFSLLSKPFPGVPQFSVVGFVDDVPIIAYTSESGMAEPRTPWMKNITDKDPQFWKDNTYIFQEVNDTLSAKLRELMEQNNQTVGLHVFQAILGCELRKDGSASSLERYAYDGSNYTANPNRAADSEETGDFEEIDCTDHLRNLLKYGEESLQRRVTPGAKVYQINANEHTFLISFTYGFYPKEIEVKWTHDGVEIPWESNELLPNPDGTYQIRTKVEVQEEDELTTYECHVTHSTMPETLTVTYDPPGRRRQEGLLVALLIVVVLVVAAVFLWKPFRAKKVCKMTQNAAEVPSKS